MQRLLCESDHAHVLTLRQRLENRIEPCFFTRRFSCRRRPKRNAENKARMAPKRNKSRSSSPDPHGMFAGMVVFLVQNGVQARRLQVWKQKLEQNGASVEERFSKSVTHVLAVCLVELLEKLDKERLSRFKGRILLYQWLEDSLSLGEKVSEDLYHINLDFDTVDKREKFSALKTDGEKIAKATYSAEGPEKSFDGQNRSDASSKIPAVIDKDASLTYSPPDMNRNITEIFGKLINIYRALGDERRSFSYYKAIPVIEKVPFRIESADQVKDLPGIGKSLQDHIQEIVDTGKLSKLEHFETDEKVKTISLFGEIWGVGPATALKLYDKGHRSLDDLRKEESLTNAQKIGLKYFNDLRQRIPRHEVQEMELLLQKAGEHVLPGVDIVCGGSFRRGKASCGDMDIVITHPDGKSHKGFLAQYIKHLKEMKFLREDLIFSTHSEEGTDSGVDTYFGLSTYPGRELRHRIDFKVYPRDIYAYGLIAWTGNDVLNRRLRLLAGSKGFRLDDTGLFPATHGSGGKKGAKGSASLKFETEKEVFDFLGFPWLQPNQRNL